MKMLSALPLLVALTLASPAIAQDTNAPAALPSADEIANRDTLTLAGGAGFVPDYEGSDDYRFIPAAAVRGRFHGFDFSSRGSYLYVDLVPMRGKVEFNAGPIVGLRLNSRSHIHDHVVKLLPRRKKAFEVGGFVGMSVHGVTNPYDNLSFRFDVLHDVGSAHKSTVFAPNIDFTTPLSRTTFVGLNVGMDFVGKKYARYYYSISPEDSLDTGGLLPVYDADGGMKNWKIGLLVNQSLSGNLLHGFSLFGAAQYSRLVGDIADSPIVEDRGSASQWLGAVGVAYTWP